MVIRQEISAGKGFWKWQSWAWLGFYTSLFALYGLLSEGLYSDDEILHALHLQKIHEDPAYLMNYFVRPGYKLLFLLQSIFGPKALLLSNAIFSGLICLYTSRIAGRMKIPFPDLSGIICAGIPIFLLLSFRMYAAIPATVFLVLAVDFLLGKNWLWAAFWLSACFLMRQEFALYGLMLGGWFLYKGNWKGLLVLAWAPLLIGIAGGIVHGDPFWLFNEYIFVFTEAGSSRPTASYFLGFGHIFGSVVVLGAGVGILFGKKRLGISWDSFGMLLGIILIHFGFQYALAWGIFGNPSPGWWRFLFPMAPFLAVFGLMGLNVLYREPWWRDPKIVISIIVLMVLTVLFFSFKHDYHNVWTDGRREGPVIRMAILLVLLLALVRLKVPPRWGFSALALFFLANNIHQTPPKKPKAEQRIMKSATDWVAENRKPDLPVYCNHFYYYYNTGTVFNCAKPQNDCVQEQALKLSPVGSWVVWDSHYGFRREKNAGVTEADLAKYNLKLIKEFSCAKCAENDFYVKVFQKQ